MGSVIIMLVGLDTTVVIRSEKSGFFVAQVADVQHRVALRRPTSQVPDHACSKIDAFPSLYYF